MLPKADVFEDFLPFVRPHFSEAAINDVVSCLRGGWITTGPRTQEFERDFGTYVGHDPRVISVTSGTVALFLALKLLDLKPGDEVIVPSMTFVASPNTIVHAGGRPVFIDIDDTLNMDVNRLESLITPRTRAIMPVHFTGLPVDLDPVYALAKAHNLTVIEDAAQALGAIYKGKMIGSFGDMQAFSFQAAKNVTTIEGGVITTRNDVFAERLKKFRFHGIDRDAWNRYTKQGSHLYDVVEAGYKYNMADVNAILGIHQLRDLEERLAKKKILVDIYMDALKGSSKVKVQVTPSYDHRHAWQLFTLLIQDEAGLSRDEFMTAMKERNIGTGLHYQPCHQFSYYKREGVCLPKTENVGARIVSLPLFPEMTEKDVDRVLEQMNDVLKGL